MPTSRTVLLDQLLSVTALLQRDMARAFDGTPLTVARVHVMWELRRLGPSTQQALAVALDVTPRNITGLVDALEASGHVVRAPHPSDRRATLVTLTTEGAEAMAVMAKEHVELADALVEGLPDREVDRMVTGLDHILGRLQALLAEAEQGQRR